MPKPISTANISLLLIFVTAILIQSSLVPTSDISYLMYVSNEIFHGKKYGIDIFETNPPMILYLYYPAIKLSQLTSLSQTICLRIFIFTLAYISLTLCKKISDILIQERLTHYLLMLSIIFILCFLPAHQFGQREHLALILTLPYFFSSVLVLEQHKLNRLPLIIIGIMAGLGFCIKPFFIFPLVLVELLLIFKTRHLLAWLRIPPVIIATTMVLYLASTFLLQPAYFSTLLPLINTFYFYGIEEDWRTFLQQQTVLFCISIFFTSALLLRKSKYKNILLVFTCALTGFMLSFIVAKSAWFYHTIPAIGMACILAVFLTSGIYLNAYKRHGSPALRTFYAGATCLILLLTLFIPIGNSILLFEIHAPDHKDEIYYQLVNYFKMSHSPRTITCFSMNTTEDCFPLVTDSQGTYTNRFPFFWWMRGAIKMEIHRPVSFAIAKPKLRELILYTVRDIQQHPTHWIVVNNADANNITGVNFDFFYYLSRHYPDFKSITLSYHKATEIGPYSIYEHN